MNIPFIVLCVILFQLTSQFNLERSMLPRKKLFGNQSEKFVSKRQKELESYLQSLLDSLPKVPYSLMTFLDFHKYVSVGFK